MSRAIGRNRQLHLNERWSVCLPDLTSGIRSLDCDITDLIGVLSLICRMLWFAGLGERPPAAFGEESCP
jgi:hypothetical protein